MFEMFGCFVPGWFYSFTREQDLKVCYDAMLIFPRYYLPQKTSLAYRLGILALWYILYSVSTVSH